MPVRCTFTLNGQATSILACEDVPHQKPYSFRKWFRLMAFSGQLSGRDNPNETAKEDIGPIPKGTYYIVDRQSGGHLGFLHDWWNAHGFGSTDRTQWFALWNPRTGDYTMVDGIKRGNFRLHPQGPLGLSEGCITVVHRPDYDKLQSFIRSQGATIVCLPSRSRARR
jgi:hypothetical protein